MGQTLCCYKSVQLHWLPFRPAECAVLYTTASSKELGSRSLLWPLGPLSFVRKSNHYHIVQGIPFSACDHEAGSSAPWSKADQEKQNRTNHQKISSRFCILRQKSTILSCFTELTGEASKFKGAPSDRNLSICFIQIPCPTHTKQAGLVKLCCKSWSLYSFLLISTNALPEGLQD